MCSVPLCSVLSKVCIVQYINNDFAEYIMKFLCRWGFQIALRAPPLLNVNYFLGLCVFYIILYILNATFWHLALGLFIVCFCSSAWNIYVLLSKASIKKVFSFIFVWCYTDRQPWLSWKDFNWLGLWQSLDRQVGRTGRNWLIWRIWDLGWAVWSLGRVGKSLGGLSLLCHECCGQSGIWTRLHGLLCLDHGRLLSKFQAGWSSPTFL